MFITNPQTNKKIIITSSLGKSILNNYINHKGGSIRSKKIDIKALWEWEEDELDDLNDTLVHFSESTLPPKIKIDYPLTLKGVYTYMGGGGGGAIYLSDTALVVKVLFSSSMGEKESRLQLKAGDISPKVHINIELSKLENEHILLDDNMLEYWEGSADVNSKIQELSVYNNEPVYIIVMDYLDIPDWIPLSKVTEIDSKSIYALLHDLVYNKGIYNTLDLVGYTGDHIFYNTDLKSYKIIDYGAFMEVKKTDDKDKLIETMWENINNKLKL